MTNKKLDAIEGVKVGMSKQHKQFVKDLDNILKKKSKKPRS